MWRNIIENKIGNPQKFFRFISDHTGEDTSKLRLKYQGNDSGFDIGFAIDQIECRKKSIHKLQSFICNPEVLFPSTLSAEQASDMRVADFHGAICAGVASFADLTAGLGIDAFAMASYCGKGVAVEFDPLRAAILDYNRKLLGMANLEVVHADSILWLEEQTGFDVIFVDPARRGTYNSRKYRFEDCQPDITLHMDLLLDHADRILIKASPLLDISCILGELRGVTHIWSVECGGECKEILIELKRGGIFGGMTAVDVTGDWQNTGFSVTAGNTGESGTLYVDAPPEKGKWLYIPGASMMKLGAWGEICRKWNGLRKAGFNSHIFVSSEEYDDFPGRKFKIDSLLRTKDLKALKGMHFDTVSRNYPLNAEALKDRIGVKGGSEGIILGTRWGKSEKPVLLMLRNSNL